MPMTEHFFVPKIFWNFLKLIAFFPPVQAAVNCQNRTHDFGYVSNECTNDADDRLSTSQNQKNPTRFDTLSLRLVYSHCARSLNVDGVSVRCSNQTAASEDDSNSLITFHWISLLHPTKRKPTKSIRKKWIGSTKKRHTEMPSNHRKTIGTSDKSQNTKQT